MSGIDKFIKAIDDVTRFIIGERRSGDDRRTSKRKTTPKRGRPRKTARRKKQLDAYKSVDWGRLRNLYIHDKQLENCKVVSSRKKILEVLPKNGICAELGVEHGIFSNKILDINKPKKLVLVDIMLQKHLQVEHDVVEPIKGDSVEVMNQFEDNYFDWIYIDTDHSEEQTNKELQICKNKIKHDGYLALHDYIRVYDNNYKFGVIESVNNFLIENEDFEVVYLSLEPHMFNTIVLRRKQ